MAFCEDCGNKVSETTKFCGECGAKIEKKTLMPRPDQTKKKPVTRKVKTSKPKAIERTTNISITDNEYLKEFFTLPILHGDEKEPSKSLVLIGLGLLFVLASLLFDPETEFWFWLLEIGFGGFLILTGVSELFGRKGFQTNEGETNIEKDGKILTKKEKLNEWKEMSPEPLFKQLEQAQRIVAKSSYENLGIDKGNTTRPSAYCYGPHLELFGDVFGSRTDETGTGKGADYYKLCEKTGLEGLYTREYDLMVVQFTKNQIMVYKCIFDILEMTKRLEESYEWNYKHVVGINITGDDKEKNLGAGLAVTGAKYLVISAASGDKIEIVLGAGTRQMVDGKQKITALGGEEKIYKVANTAMKNIREAVREGAS